MGTLYKKKEREKKKLIMRPKDQLFMNVATSKPHNRNTYVLESVQALNFKLKYNFKRLIKNGSTFTLPVHGCRWQKN